MTWDEETGGILLTETQQGGIEGSLRPVFHEELDLLGFKERWQYQRGEAPLLWAAERRYYYRGRLVAEAKGGNFFEAPQITYFVESLTLQPVDVPEMIRRNASLMEGLTHRAIEFVHHQYEAYRSKVDAVTVAFSGGKDSLVVLDLVQRALPPDSFVVVFSDTTMELSSTYEAVERAKQRWPQLRFHTAHSTIPAPQSWRLFGPPSRLHRWCCTVHKTAPNHLVAREITGKPSVLAVVFDGVRWEESEKRATYLPVTERRKHFTQINASPIIAWNSGEVYIYTFERDLLLNKGYRTGLSRVGCCVCPFGSKWGEAVLGAAHRSDIASLLSELEAYASTQEIPHGSTRTYISDGRWKMRAGGRGIDAGRNRVLESTDEGGITFLVNKPRSDWREWAKALGPRTVEGVDKGKVQVGPSFYGFSLVERPDALEVRIVGSGLADQSTRSLFRAVANKAAYCNSCRGCEVECHSGALSVTGSVQIDEQRCTHCHTCLTHIEKGCWAAKSLWITDEGSKMRKIGTYQTFGMTTAWLEEYLSRPDDWWRVNTLGTRQFQSMRLWLAEAEITDRGGKITPFGKRIQAIGSGAELSWLLIWTNLARNSGLINWYVHSVPWDTPNTKDNLVAMLPVGSERSRQNAIAALAYLLKYSPLGEDLGFGRLGQGNGRQRTLSKVGPTSVPPAAILYAIYRYAESARRHTFTLRELEESQEGPISLFHMPAADLARVLRGIAVSSDLVSVELQHDLDSIYLNASLTAQQVIGRI